MSNPVIARLSERVFGDARDLPPADEGQPARGLILGKPVDTHALEGVRLRPLPRLERGHIVAAEQASVGFVTRLGELAVATGAPVYAWAVLSNHAHLLLRSRAQGLPQFTYPVTQPLCVLKYSTWGGCFFRFRFPPQTQP